MLAGGSLIIGSGLLIALAARNNQVALRPTSPVDEAYARFFSCQSAVPLARPGRRFLGRIRLFTAELTIQGICLPSC